MRRAPDEPRFTPGIALLAWFAAFLLAQIGGLVLLSATGYAGKHVEDYPIWLIAVLQVPLWVGLAGAAVLVSRVFGTRDLGRDYGFHVERVDVLGFPIGVLAQLVFVRAIYWLLDLVGVDTSSVSDAAEKLTNKATNGLAAVLLVVLVVIGAPIVEELFFRGLVMRSLQARWSDSLALVGSAVLFGLAHFQLLQLPALVMFGLIAGYCAQRTGRLGLSMFAHAGFNATTVYLLLR